MASEKPQLVVQVSPDAHAAQEIAEGLAAFEKAGVGRHNNKTVPGGKFIGTDGKFHDAHGRKLEDADAGIAKMSAEDAAAELAELNARRDELQARVQQAQLEEQVNAEVTNAAAAEDAAPKAKSRKR
jgi:hypothetical protein